MTAKKPKRKIARRFNHPIDQRSRVRIILWISFIVVLLDQLTKQVAIHYLRGKAPHVFLGNLFRLEYAENPGAFLGLGSTMPPWLRFWLMTVAVAGILVVCLYYVVKDSKLTGFATFGFSLVVSGGFSNLLDRIFRTEGRVVDFMNMGIGELRTGIFNVADMAIMGGIFMVLIHLVNEPEVKATKKATS